MVPKNLKIFILILIFYSHNFVFADPDTNSSKMINFGFFNMFKRDEFKNPFSSGIEDKKTYYRMPDNSWNDLFYITLSYDWNLKKLLNFRYGWELEINFSGSGNSEGDAAKIEKDTDLGKVINATRYADFVDHKFTFYLNFSYFFFKFKIFEPYFNLSAGLGLGWFTYNEIVGNEVSEGEKPYRDTFIKIFPALKISSGTVIKISETINDIFIQFSYKFAIEPLLKYSVEERYIKFQISGFMIGAGFRY